MEPAPQRPRGLVERLLDRVTRSVAAAHNRELHAVRREIDELRNAVVALSGRLDGAAATRKQIDTVLANQRIYEAKTGMTYQGITGRSVSRLTVMTVAQIEQKENSATHASAAG